MNVQSAASTAGDNTGEDQDNSNARTDDETDTVFDTSYYGTYDDYVAKNSFHQLEFVCVSLLTFSNGIFKVPAIMSSGTKSLTTIDLTIGQISQQSAFVLKELYSTTARRVMATQVSLAIDRGHISLYLDSTVTISSLQQYLRMIVILLGCHNHHKKGVRTEYYDRTGSSRRVSVGILANCDPVDAVQVRFREGENVITKIVHPLTIVIN